MKRILPKKVLSLIVIEDIVIIDIQANFLQQE